jgi:hypothetical protein
MGITTCRFKISAKIIHPGNTEVTPATGGMDPGHTDPITNLKAFYLITRCGHPSNYLMTGDNRENWWWRASLDFI